MLGSSAGPDVPQGRVGPFGCQGTLAGSDSAHHQLECPDPFLQGCSSAFAPTEANSSLTRTPYKHDTSRDSVQKHHLGIWGLIYVAHGCVGRSCHLSLRPRYGQKSVFGGGRDSRGLQDLRGSEGGGRGGRLQEEGGGEAIRSRPLTLRGRPSRSVPIRSEHCRTWVRDGEPGRRGSAAPPPPAPAGDWAPRLRRAGGRATRGGGWLPPARRSGAQRQPGPEASGPRGRGREASRGGGDCRAAAGAAGGVRPAAGCRSLRLEPGFAGCWWCALPPRGCTMAVVQ